MLPFAEKWAYRAQNHQLDRSLPKIDNEARRRYVSLDLNRLDALLKTFFAQAIEKKDAQAGLLVVKILERRALLLGLDSPQKLDIVQVQAVEEPSDYARVREAILRVANGNGTGTEPSDLDPVPSDPKPN